MVNFKPLLLRLFSYLNKVEMRFRFELCEKDTVTRYLFYMPQHVFKRTRRFYIVGRRKISLPPTEAGESGAFSLLQ